MAIRDEGGQRGRMLWRALLRAAVLLSVTLVACGPGSAVPDSDAGATDADSSDASRSSTPADIPWLDEGEPPIAAPMFTPCPEGWHEVVDEGPGMELVTCHPYGGAVEGDDPDACADGWAHFVGDEGCTPVGAPCPAGDFPEGLPRDVPVLYVLASAAPGGDGSEGAPLATISEALAVASAGTVVAIGKGEYDEVLRPSAGVTLWGACAAETRLTASSPPTWARGVITVAAADTQVVNLRIGPSDLPGLVVHGTGASVSIDGLLIDSVQEYGVLVRAGAHARGRELAVFDTRADSRGRSGHGITAWEASEVSLTRVFLTGNRVTGVFASDPGTSVTLSDMLGHSTLLPEGDSRGGVGLLVQAGATLELSRALLSQNRNLGAYAIDEGTVLTLSEVVVQNTLAETSDGAGGRGLNGLAGVTIRVNRAVFSGNRGIGAFGSGLGTSLTLSDIVVRDTLTNGTPGNEGRGVGVESGATLALERAVVLRNRGIGAFASGLGTSLTLSDVRVRDTLAQEGGTGGRGLNVQQGASSEVTRAVFSRNRKVGVFASNPDTSLTLSDVVVRDTLAQESDGLGGRGLNVQEGASMEVSRAVISRSRDIGVLSGAEGALLRLTDVIVAQVDEQACVATTCAERPFGVGLAATISGRLEATRFQVIDAALCGVMVTADGQVDLSDGEVSGSQIGVCLQVEGYDVARLTDGVRFLDNDTNLASTTLPVPVLGMPLGEER